MSVVELRDVVIVRGRDAEAYLHGQLSADVRALAPGASTWTFVLEPTGKLGHLARVLRVDEECFELDTDPGEGDALAARLRRFLLRTAATLEQRELRLDIDGDPAVAGVRVGWWGEGAHVPTDAPATPDEVHARRVAASWPAYGREITEGVIPGETTLVPLVASFTKGCYTGQELVARIDSRGNHVPRLLRRVLLGGPAAPGDPVLVDGAEVGALTSVSGVVGLAYVRRSVEVPSDAVVAGSAAAISGIGPAPS